jgi:hypothetical protein
LNLFVIGYSSAGRVQVAPGEAALQSLLDRLPEVASAK